MVIFDDDRPSDSPFVERVWRSHSEGAEPFLSIAESRCELVVTRLQGKMALLVRGPETRATLMRDYPPEAEWLGIRLKPGVFLPDLPGSALVDASVALPDASSSSFWLAGSSWRYPNYDNADTFIGRLARAGLLVREDVVGDALQGRPSESMDQSLRSVQRRFLLTTGVTQTAFRQIERARYATLLLRQGASIPDATFAAGYFDQAHLTRSLQRYIGQSPGQLARPDRSARLSFLYKTRPFS